MSAHIKKRPHFTIGISTRALFDLEKENEIFEREGTKAYVAYQIAHEQDILSPGAAFGLIQAFLSLNQEGEEPLIEVVIMSKNSAEASLRMFHSIAHYGLDITKAALTSGASIVPYLKAYAVDLYLSFDAKDVRAALASGVAAGQLMCRRGEAGAFDRSDIPEISQIRLAFDGDAVLFSAEAERIFQDEGLLAFCESEREKAHVPLQPGPFAHVLAMISEIQKRCEGSTSPIRTALVTARSAPAHERAIRTLQAWGIGVDEAFFLGGMDKSAVLSAFGAHIFFDDNETNTRNASYYVLSACVPTDIRSA